MNSSKIEFVDIKDLKPYEKNNKKHPKQQIEAIAVSIKRLGFINPILIDDNNIIVAGHGRLKALEHLREKEGDFTQTGNGEDLDLTKIKVMRVSNLTENELKAYRIWDNKSAEIAEWDWESMKIDFDELKLEGLDDLTGFTEEDFKFLDRSSTEQMEKTKDIAEEKRLKHLAICPKCNHEFKLTGD